MFIFRLGVSRAEGMQRGEQRAGSVQPRSILWRLCRRYPVGGRPWMALYGMVTTRPHRPHLIAMPSSSQRATSLPQSQRMSRSASRLGALGIAAPGPTGRKLRRLWHRVTDSCLITPDETHEARRP
jgi:hypothetical protein